MSADKNLIEKTKKLMLAKYPRFGSEIAVTNIEYKTDLKYHTIAADGKNIYVDPNYLESLSEDDRLFLIAHEIMHIKFMHAYRLLDTNGNIKDIKTWNIATDAIINANLERDGFRIKEGYINRPEALNYSAEEFYEILLKENKKKSRENKANKNKEDNQKQQGEQSGEAQQSNSQGGQSKNNDGDENSNGGDSEENILNEEENYGDDHSLWEESFENRQNEKNKKSEQSKKGGSKKEKQSSDKTSEIEFDFNEKGEFEKNRREKREIFKSKREQTRKRNSRRNQ